MTVVNWLPFHELKALAESLVLKRVWKRFQAVTLTVQGRTVEDIADVLNCSVRAVYAWVADYNRGGPDALLEGRHTGRKPKFDPKDWPRLKQRIDDGPQPGDNCCAFHCHDIQRILAAEFDLIVSVATVNRILHRYNYSSLVPRPKHEKTDAEVQDIYKEVVIDQIDATREAHPDKEIHVHFEDEARLGTQGTVTRIWGETGTRASVIRQNGRIWIYVILAVCLATGNMVMMTSDRMNTEVINGFLERFSQSLPPHVHAVLIWDGAGFHRSQQVVTPANVTLILLPPYSPELNPVENLWHYLRSHKWSNQRYRDKAHLRETATKSVQDVGLDQKSVRRICNAPYITERPAA